MDISCFAASAKAHIRQSILSSEEAMKIVTERHELQEMRTLLQKVRDRLTDRVCCSTLLSICFLASLLYVIARPSVCLKRSCTLPTQTIEIFGNVSTPFGTVAIC